MIVVVGGDLGLGLGLCVREYLFVSRLPVELCWCKLSTASFGVEFWCCWVPSCAHVCLPVSEEGFPGPEFPESIFFPPIPLMHNDDILQQPVDLESLTPRYTEQVRAPFPALA